MDNDFKKILGMTQENMAMLLQIPQSQWSMFACGQRSLPVVATVQLAEMLQFSKSNENKNFENLEATLNQKAALEKYVANQIIENNRKIIELKQKLIVIEKKFETAIKARNFINFLEASAAETNESYKLLLQSIKQDAENKIEKNSLLIQEQIKIKIKLLEGEIEFYTNYSILEV